MCARVSTRAGGFQEMGLKRTSRALGVGVALVGVMVVAGMVAMPGTSIVSATGAAKTAQWPQQNRTGNVRLDGLVPFSVQGGQATFLQRHDPNADLRLNFALPL